ncbi:MAG: shikimate dehydrogenase [Chloroflexi bacterium]|nr:shikimate dehydrogenase [Chloroflexota bacterium]
MSSFACVIHPVSPKQDVARKYPLLAKVLPTPLIHFFSRFWPPVYLSRITGVRSEATGKEIEGWLLACPFTARQMLRLPPKTAYRKIVQTGGLAEKLGADILGLLAFTSVIGDGGVTIAQNLTIPVTTGRSLTVAAAVEGLTEAAQRRGIHSESATVAVVGATGSIGLACARLLAPMVAELILVGRQKSRLERVRKQVREAGNRKVRTSVHLEAIRDADMILSTTNAAKPIIQPEHLKQGAVVCDVALPPDVSPRVTRERDDVLCVHGGVMDVPGEVDFHFDFGLAPGRAYACMAETMVLALEGRYESYSLGKQMQPERVREIAQLARKHGFKLSEL